MQQNAEHRKARISVPFGDGRNPSPSGEEKVLEVPEGDERGIFC